MKAALVSLLLALPLFAQFGGEYRFEPPAPTDRSFTMLQVRQMWRDGCLPIEPQVTRNANAIQVRWRTMGGGCPLSITEWIEDVPLGVLSAGTYTVTLQVDTHTGLETVATLPLVVAEGAPSIFIEPRIANMHGGTTIRFPDICEPATVIVDGVTVPSRVERCHLTAELPAHAPGAVNVRVITASRTYDVVNALQFIDPAAAPDPSLYERVLLPVIFQGAGAFGSEWKTEILMRNFSQYPVHAIPNAARPFETLGGGAPTQLAPLFGNRPSGAVLFVPRGSRLGFTSHIRDASRDAAQWGTELPVVREKNLPDRIIFANVPFDSRYRVQLRIYGIDGVGGPVLVIANPNAYAEVNVPGPCEATPCNSNEPAYLSFDLSQRFSVLNGGRYSISVLQQELQPQRLWAFITVTNNETQHVTVISPQ